MPQRAAPPDRRQAGVALVLATLVLAVLIVIVFQVQYAARIELDYARSFVRDTQARMLADATRRHVESLLLQDLEDADEGAAAGGDALAGGEAGGGLFDDRGGGAQSNPVDDVTGVTDSLLDEWMSPAALTPPIGEGQLTVIVEVEDEDGKINLLGLWSADEEAAERQREIVARLLDRAFEGTSRDLSFGDGLDAIDGFRDWVDGQRPGGHATPLPERKPDSELADEEDELQGFGEIDDRHFPLTLEEILVAGGLLPEHIWGFRQDDVFHPGLERYLTVFSNLELLPPDDEEDEFSESAFAGIQDEEDEEAQAAEEQISAAPAQNGLVNVNTAPYAVLRALANDDIRAAVIEKIVEFRERALEELEQGEQRLGRSEPLGVDPDEAAEGDPFTDAERDASDYVFESRDEVFALIEDEFRITVNADDDSKNEFQSLLATRSQVFTIKIMVLDEAADRRATYRTTVWRMEATDRPRIVSLLPLEPYPDPRRPDDYGAAEDFRDAFDLPPDERLREARRR